MGRPRKPTALKKLEGRRCEGDAVEAPLGIPTPPAHLTGLSLKLWNSLAPRLDQLGLVSLVDGMALEGLCVAYARAVEADQIIARNGLTIVVGTDAGNKVERVRPQVAISRDAWAQVLRLGVEFGITPASRGKLSVAGKSLDDDLEALLASPARPDKAIQ